MTPETALAAVELWPVVIDEVIEEQRSADLFRLYLEAFGPLRTQAAAKHLMNVTEFEHEMRDPRILKYTVWRSPNDPVALCTITTHLDAVPWVSPDFYAARYPAHAARRAIYYLGLALVAPEPGHYRLFESVIRETVAACAAEHGVLVYDVCRYNDTTVRFGRRAEAGLRRLAPVRVGVIDVQTYYEAVFD